ATTKSHTLFFQAEDGIRDRNVTGVQTCALPICDIIFYNLDTEATYTYDPGFKTQIAHMKEVFAASDAEYKVVLMHRSAYPMSYEIGRARVGKGCGARGWRHG